MDFKVISRNVGLALLFSAMFMFLSIIVSVIYGNDSALAALIISFTITFVFAIFPFIFVRRKQNITLTDGYMIIVLSWLLSCLFGMLPYILYGGPFTVINAFFESASGYTTTGGTILENIESLPPSLLFWRSSTHFIGGFGVVVFLLLILPSTAPVRLRLSNMELSSLSREGYHTKVNRTAAVFTYVYLALVSTTFIAYVLCGMPVFDAINHAMTVASTGGFSPKNLSIGFYDSAAINIVTIVMMIAGAIHFGLIYTAFVTRSAKPLNNPILKTYLAMIAITSAIVSLNLKISGTEYSWGDAIMNGTFEVASYATSTGLAITDNSVWPALSVALLMVVCVPNGMAGSTAGGFKIDRLYIFVKSLGRQIRSAVNPNVVKNVKIGDRVIPDKEIYPHLLYLAMYFFLVLLVISIPSLFGIQQEDSWTGALACITNTGPGAGTFGSLGNYNSLNDATKLFYSGLMILGRLEIYPVLVFLYLIFRRRRQ